MQILRERVRTWEAHHAVVWNSHPGALLTLPSFSDTLAPLPFHRHSPGHRPEVATRRRNSFTAVVYAALPTIQPLQRLLRAMLRSKYLARASGLSLVQSDLLIEGVAGYTPLLKVCSMLEAAQ